MEHDQLTFSDYLSILRRRGWVMTGTFGALFAAAVAVAMLLPPLYRSTGTILVESQQIPVDLVQATVTSYADERIEVIKQRVMTRENLLRIIAKYKLFADAGPTFTPSEQIDEMRKSIAVELVSANVKPGTKGSGTIAFRVSFEGDNAGVAQQVANDLITLFLNENVKVRTERASQTTEFLTQESDKLKQELARLESQIAAYKQEHGKALPENVTLGLAAMQRAEADLRQVERDQAAAQEELREVESERAGAAMTQPASPAPVVASAAAGELQKARAELARLNAVYTDNHPDVRSMKRRLESLEQAVAAEAVPAAGNAAFLGGVEAAMAKLDARAAALRERIRLLGVQQASLRGRLVQMEGELVKSPQVERGLAALTRDYQSAQRKFEEIHAKKMTAQVAENLEGDQKAERFAILEPPVLPDRPIKPDRKKAILLGFFLACAGAAGLVVLLETLHGTVRGVEAISAVLGMRPLVTVPVIPVAAELGQRRRLYAQVAAGSSMAVGAALAALHFLYLPLDLLLMKVIMRLS